MNPDPDRPRSGELAVPELISNRVKSTSATPACLKYRVTIQRQLREASKAVALKPPGTPVTLSPRKEEAEELVGDGGAPQAVHSRPNTTAAATNAAANRD